MIHIFKMQKIENPKNKIKKREYENVGKTPLHGPVIYCKCHNINQSDIVVIYENNDLKKQYI